MWGPARVFGGEEVHLQARPVSFERSSGEVLFALDGVGFVYPDGTEALREVSLAIHEGDRIALVGHNGSGKTTLARMLCGLITPTRGSLLYRGLKPSVEDLRELRREVGLLFQDPDDHLFSATLLEDVLFGPLNWGWSARKAEEAALDVLHRLGLEKERFKAPHHLSYGQRKRAALAAVLAQNPRMLILDEPTANVDPRNEAAIFEILEDYPGTLVCISHDLLFLYRLCDRAVVLQEGTVHHDYSFQELVSHRASLREHGLDFTFRFQCCQDPESHDTGNRRPSSVPKNMVKKGNLFVDAGREDPRVESRVSRERSRAVIDMQDYWFRYPDGTWGLRGVSFRVEPGERIALVGENGAGKSTLASCLVGIRSGRGEYRFQGTPVGGSFRKELWRHMGIVFQDSSDQMVCPSCWEEVAFGLKNLGWPEDRIRDRVREMLDWVGLKHAEDRVPQHLSSGERKRLALAAVLAMNPEVLILDEPTANLDPAGEEQLLRLLDDVGITLVLITHDVCFASMLTDRTMVMHGGKIVRDTSTADFLMDDHLHSLYGLDLTYHNQCCREIFEIQRTANPSR